MYNSTYIYTLVATSKIIDFKKTRAKVCINPKFGLTPTSQLIKLKRIQDANDEIVAFDQTWLPGIYGQLFFDEILENKTIYEVLEEKYEIPITAGSYTFYCYEFKQRNRPAYGLK